ncbi:MAG: hypothetical protein AAFU75_03150, partial [Planctomycetota bacterium]
MRRQITAVLFTMIALSGAHGQATFGTASDPITGAMLERWFAELDLSQPQSQAVDRLHALYLDEFADVRGDEIEDVAGRGGIFGAIYGGGDISAMFREIDQLRDDIEDVDENFIEQIRPLLSANQAPALDRLA